MGVTGLWRLIDSSGKPVPLESLEGKVLAIDVSIWIHQVLQGYQDGRGNAVPNAHLLGLFNRICKLLYFKIKPVFVFDGGVPMLKKNTIAARKKQKVIALGKAEDLKNDLLLNLMKHSLVKGVLTNKITDAIPGPSTSKSSDSSKALKSVNDMFKLPAIPDPGPESSAESSEDDSSPRKNSKWRGNIHTVDVNTEEFKSLPATVRYDILTDLKETRKQNSWGRLHEIPEESNQFSSYQMQRLLKRRKVQEYLESAEKEMGGRKVTMEELEKLMLESGVNTDWDLRFRIAADNVTRIIYVDKMKGRSEDYRYGVSEDESQPGCSKDSKNELTVIPEEPSATENVGEYLSDDLNDWDSDVELIEAVHSAPKRFFGKVPKNPALSYMLENSELSQEQILALIEQSKGNIKKAKVEERTKRKKPDGQKVPKNSESNYFEIQELIGAKDQEVSYQEFLSDDDVHELDTNGETEASLIDKSTDREKTLCTDSDSDDFVEVQEATIPKLKSEKKMEIVIDANGAVDDDLFADVFETKSEDKSVALDSGNSSCEIPENGASGLEKQDDETMNLTLETRKESVFLNDEIAMANISGPTEGNLSVEEVSQLSSSISSDTQQPFEKIDSSLENRSKSPETRAADSVVHIHLDNSPMNQQAQEACEFISSNSIPSIIEADSNNLQESPTSTESAAPFFSPSKTSKISSILNRLETEKPHLLSKISKISSQDHELQELEAQLSSENQELKQTIGKLDRQATEVTEQMRLDAQDLLRLFGIPYVVAPQEAEAQCAYLEEINLTDGSITDDSDIWLFGGKCVYRNFFNSAKAVMQYLSTDIERQFKLTRQQMIQMALLVGSDYTVGIPGIGPVTALEIIASFPSEGDDLLRGLSKFSSWVRGGRVVGPGKTALRNKLKNVIVERGFPSQSVVQAYLFPTVDESKETFSWGKPNVVLLGDYTRQKFGWTKAKFDEIMGPVVKRMLAKAQRNLLAYFKVKHVPKELGDGISKRVLKAVQRLGNRGMEEDEDSPEVVVRRKRRRVKKAAGENDDTGDKAVNVEAIEKESLPQEGTDAMNDSTVDRDEVHARIGGRKVVKTVKEIIPQREKDKQNALDKKLKAIEVFRKSRKGPGKTKGKLRVKRNVVREAQLSESDSD